MGQMKRSKNLELELELLKRELELMKVGWNIRLNSQLERIKKVEEALAMKKGKE